MFFRNPLLRRRVPYSRCCYIRGPLYYLFGWNKLYIWLWVRLSCCLTLNRGSLPLPLSTSVYHFPIYLLIIFWLFLRAYMNYDNVASAVKREHSSSDRAVLQKSFPNERYLINWFLFYGLWYWILMLVTEHHLCMYLFYHNVHLITKMK